MIQWHRADAVTAHVNANDGRRRLTHMNTLIFLSFSVVILVLPDIILNIVLYQDYKNLLFIASKAAQFVFAAGVAAVLLRSFYRAYALVGGLYLLSSLFEIVNVSLLNQYVSMDNLRALFSTTASESVEFISRFGVFLLLDVVVLLAFLLCLTNYKKLPFVFSRRLVHVIGAAGVIAIAVPVMWVFDSDQRFAGKNLAKHIVRQKLLKEHPVSVYYRTYEVGLYTAQYAKLIAGRSHHRFGATVGGTKPRLVVLVIGEGMRYSNWSVNGYGRPTSPRLSKLDNLISFRRHYSNANSTAASIPLILTQATPESVSVAYSEGSILSLYKEAGYHTAWISNQYIYYLDNKSEADAAYDLFEERRLDGAVLPVLDEVLTTRQADDKFIIVNLSGNHGDTPEAFLTTFEPNSGGRVTSIAPGNKALLVNDYDSKILYQDFVLSEIIKRLQRAETTALLLFTADHGVNLFDDKDNAALFGYGSSNPTQSELHVPLFLWVSDRYKEQNLGIVNALRANAASVSTNDNVFDTLADVSSIEYKGFDEHRSVASSAYRPDERVQVLVNGERVFRDVQAQ